MLPSDMCNNTPKLKILFLRANQIYGKIPRSIYKCSKMEKLSLSMNMFNGNIPTEFGNLSMLTFLSIYDNDLQGKYINLCINSVELSYWFQYSSWPHFPYFDRKIFHLLFSTFHGWNSYTSLAINCLKEYDSYTSLATFHHSKLCSPINQDTIFTVLATNYETKT